LAKVRDADWPRNGIDHFVLARLEREGLTPSPEANKPTLLRRVTLDLTGLLPTLAELDAFLNDDSPGAYAKAVDRLLDSPRYGEHMALGWMEASRYADTDGYQNDRLRYMWVWRDWLIKTLNDNMPFDRFITEQMAGDLLPDRNFFTQVATGKDPGVTGQMIGGKKNQVQISAHGHVLESIIKQQHVSPHVNSMPGRKTTNNPGQYHDPGQCFRKKTGLITDQIRRQKDIKSVGNQINGLPGGTAVPPADHRRFIPVFQKQTRKILHHRGFSSAAQGEITHTDNRHRQLFGPEQAAAITTFPNTHQSAVQWSKGPTKHEKKFCFHKSINIL